MSFSKAVLELAKKIPSGKITTYSEIAVALKKPKAQRAVGNALNRNKEPVKIPCHRVIKSTGEVGGYSRGKEKKTVLLENEGIPIKDGKVISYKRYLYRFRD